MPCTSSHKHCRSTINPKCSPRIQNLHVRPSVDTFARVSTPESCLNSPRLFSSALLLYVRYSEEIRRSVHAIFISFKHIRGPSS